MLIIHGIGIRYQFENKPVTKNTKGNCLTAIQLEDTNANIRRKTLLPYFMVL